MDFLFRAPLFDFDPRDKVEIIKNWSIICRAIQNSSSSFHSELDGKLYEDLSPKIKAKLFKYLLRGRYRPTPFGYFAGVGTGVFSETINPEIDIENFKKLNSKEDLIIKQDKINCNYVVASGLQFKSGKIYYLSFLEDEGRWVQISIPTNTMLEYLLDSISNKKQITNTEFKEFFPDSTENSIQEVWNQMIYAGIIIPLNEKRFYLPIKESIDLIFDTRATLPVSIKNDLETLIVEGGNLFYKSPNPYLDSFTRWFFSLFDDRLVSLEQVLKDQSFITSSFLNTYHYQNQRESVLNFSGHLWECEKLDLKKLLPINRINKSIFDLSLVFRLDGAGSPVIENIVCNRPFVYFGRFNQDKKIEELEGKIKQRIYTSDKVIYAELVFSETAEIHLICSTKRIFDHYISPFSDTSESSIQLNDICIGVHSNRIILIHRPSNKQIIPIVLHPLNGNEISHPAMRLLWEISNQEGYKFLPYLQKGFLESNYTPQLNWGKLVLQSRRWFIRRSEIKDKNQLLNWIESNFIPHPILAGYLDRELLLHWKEDKELEILWTEIQRVDKIVLSESLWVSSTVYKSKESKSIFPQFIYQYSQPKKEEVLEYGSNYIEMHDKQCLYVVLYSTAEEAADQLLYTMEQVSMAYPELEKLKWYYLFYPMGVSLQIRIRFLQLDEGEKTEILAILLKRLEMASIKFEIRPYFPETMKYGDPGFKQSEKIFHLESIFFLGLFMGNPSPINWNDEMKIDSIVQIWLHVLPVTGLLQEFFEILKPIIKQTEYKTIKKFKLINSDSCESGTLNEFLNSYKELMKDHPELKDGNSNRISILLNHLHMQINRFFPENNGEIERGVQYRLYKGLGQVMYSR